MPQLLQFNPNDKKIFSFLQTVDIFTELSKPELKQVVSILQYHGFDKGEFIFSEQDDGNLVYIIEEGRLFLSLPQKTIIEMGRGYFFGEMAFIDNNTRSGSVRADSVAKLFSFSSHDLLDADQIPPELALKIYMQLSKRVVSYLRHEAHLSTKELIRRGENEFVEFKSTLRCNLHTMKTDKSIEHASLKSIAAFLNAQGGTLFIGIRDDGSALGIEQDKFENDDKALLHITNIIKQTMGTKVLGNIHLSLEMIEGKKIIRVDCNPSPEPIYLDHQNEVSFYVRSGPSTSKLKVNEIYNYVKNRFHIP